MKGTHLVTAASLGGSALGLVLEPNRRVPVTPMSPCPLLATSLTSQRHTGTSTRGLVHLTVHQGHLGLAALLAQLDDTLHKEEGNAHAPMHSAACMCLQHHHGEFTTRPVHSC